MSITTSPTNLRLENSFGGEGGNPHGEKRRVFHPRESLSSKSEADKEFTAGCCSQPTLRRKEINRGVPKIAEGDSGLSVRRDNSQIYCKTEIGNSVTFTPFLNRWISVGDGVFIP